MSKRQLWCVVGVLALGTLVLRLMLADHRLPEMQVGDENSDLSNAVRMLNGDVDNIWHSRLAITYLNIVSVGWFFGWNVLTGVVSGVAEFEGLYFAERWRFTLATRQTIAVLSAGMIGLVAVAGVFFNRRTALFAALGLSLNGFFLLNTVYAMPDATIALAAILTVVAALMMWSRPSTLTYTAAGASLALIAVSKMHALPLGAALLVAHGFAARDHTSQPFWRAFFAPRVLLVPAGALVGFFVLDPFALLYPQDLLAELGFFTDHAYNATPPSTADLLLLMRVHLIEMAHVVWRGLLPASLLGLVAAWRYRSFAPYWIVLAGFVALFVVVITIVSPNYKVFYWIPWTMTLVLLSAVGLDTVLQWADRPAWRFLGYTAVLVIFTVEGAFLYRMAAAIQKPDTRQLAKTYIEANWPEDTRVMLGDSLVYTVPLERSVESIERALALGVAPLARWQWRLNNPQARVDGPVYDLYGPEMQRQIDTFDDVQRLIHDESVLYVIEVSLCAHTSQNRPDSESAIEYPAISPEMRAGFERVATFHPYSEETCVASINDRTGLADYRGFPHQQYLGPVVEIYRTTAE